MSDKSKQFADWLEGKQTQPADSDMLLLQDTAEKIMHSAGQYKEQPVPSWDRSAGFVHEKSPWWQWQGLPAVSFATSMLALVMVFFKVEVAVSDDEFSISFAGKKQRQQVEQLVSEKIQAFSNDQMVALANYAADLQDQQNLANAQLANHLITSSRQERKEDFAELVKFIDQQRKDDQYLISRKIANLREDNKQNRFSTADYRIEDQE